MQNQNNNNIVLIGMPGAGKSTVGVVLAKILNYEFIDADLIIQQRMGKTLSELIEELGADGFISLEGEILSTIKPTRAIISTGGSAVYSQDAIAELAQNGAIVYLQIALDELRVRLGDLSERGVVIKDDHVSTMTTDQSDILAALYNERLPLYEAAADVAVCVDNLSISEAAQAVREALVTVA